MSGSSAAPVLPGAFSDFGIFLTTQVSLPPPGKSSRLQSWTAPGLFSREGYFNNKWLRIYIKPCSHADALTRACPCGKARLLNRKLEASK